MSLLIACLCCLAVETSQADSDVSHAPTSARPFATGERLTYEVSWFGIPAGTAVSDVAVIPPVGGRDTLKFTISAQTNSVVTKFYPVDNRVESTVDAARLLPLRTVFRRREGKRKNDFDVTFHHEEGTVTVDKDGTVETLPMPRDTHDTISCLYYFRSLPVIKPGTSVTFNVHHDRKNYQLTVQVEGIETLTGPWGAVEAVRVLVIMPFQGIFLNEGNIRVWMTNDQKRVPLMMKAKVIIGSVTARLIDGIPMPPAP